MAKAAKKRDFVEYDRLFSEQFKLGVFAHGSNIHSRKEPSPWCSTRRCSPISTL
jgi:hypothetical protein